MKRRLVFVILILSLIILVKPLSIYSQTSSSQDYRLQQIEKLSATASTQPATSSAKPNNTSLTFISGNLSSVSGSTIFLSTDGGIKLIYTSDSTKFYNFDASGKKLIGIGDLKSGDSVNVIGLSPQTNSGSAKIVVRDQTIQVKNFGLIGKVSDINPSTIQLSNMTRTDLPIFHATINSDTTVTNASKQNLKSTDILANDLVVIAGYFDDKNNLITKQIFRTFLTATTNNSTSSAK